MMTLLSEISKPEKRPLIGTVLGEAGVGKNSFCSTFEKPIYIRVEDGINRQSRLVDMPDAFPVCRTAQDVYDQLLTLLNEDHDYKTLIIDSTTSLDSLFTVSILEKDKATTLARAAGGYGAGVELLSNMHGRVRKAAGLLNQRKGMTVWFIAHADLETMRLPDQDDYLRYSLRLSKRAHTYYIDDVDFVGHIKLESALRGGEDERKRVISDGSRELVCHSTAASVTKNGFGITEPLPFVEGTNPLAEYLADGHEHGNSDDVEKPAKPKRKKQVADSENFDGVEEKPVTEVDEDDQPDGEV